MRRYAPAPLSVGARPKRQVYRLTWKCLCGTTSEVRAEWISLERR